MLGTTDIFYKGIDESVPHNIIIITSIVVPCVSRKVSIKNIHCIKKSCPYFYSNIWIFIRGPVSISLFFWRWFFDNIKS